MMPTTDPLPPPTTVAGLPRYTAIVVATILVTVVVTTGFLVWSGKDIGPYVGFIIGFVPPTVGILVSVRQNEQLLRYSGEIKANVNGNLSQLLKYLAASSPVKSLEFSTVEEIKRELTKRTQGDVDG
jgi:hypothetical protein